MEFAGLLSVLPPELRINIADVGSAGGLHERWTPVRRHVSALLFDPFDEQSEEPGIAYVPTALGAAAGRSPLHVLRRVSMTSTLLPNAERLKYFQDKPEHIEVTSTLEVPVETLDQVAGERGVALDLLKIDVQGGEFGVLEGATRCLTGSIFFAEIETSFFERYVGLVPFDGVLALMRERGFDLLDLGRPKRYRYGNSAGIAVEGSVSKAYSPLGKLAFADAYFLLREDLLLARVEGDAELLLKVLTVLMLYGKADVANWLFDAAGAVLPEPARAAITDDFVQLRRFYRRKNLRKRIRRRLRGIT